MTKLMNYLSAMFSCLVPRNGGGVSEQLVYGKRTSELGIADFYNNVVTYTDESFVMPFDGCVLLWATPTTQTFIDLKVNGTTVKNFPVCVPPNNNYLFSAYIKKGQTVSKAHDSGALSQFSYQVVPI